MKRPIRELAFDLDLPYSQHKLQLEPVLELVEI